MYIDCQELEVGEELTVMGQCEGILGSDGTILCLDCRGGNTTIFVCPNS